MCSLSRMLKFITIPYSANSARDSMNTNFGSFRFVNPPQLNGCILFAFPRGTSHILHNDLLGNGTSSVTGGHNVVGKTNGKDPSLSCFVV